MIEVLDYVQFVLAPQVVTGLTLGVAVILVALGLTIIFGLLDVINMSHGEFYALGAFIALALNWMGVPFWALLIIIPLLMLPLGYVVERTLIQRVFNSKDRHVTTLLLTFGFGLVLEEINRVPTDTVSVLYPLLLERRINGHSLAPGWKLGVTMNPDTLNYAVNSLDDAMLDRFVTVEVTANLEDYVAYSLQNGPCDDVLAYLTACPDMLLRVKKAADSTATAKSPTPRGWTRVQQLLNNCALSDKLMQELISGVLGPEAAASFFGYLKNREYTIPSASALLADFEQVRPQFEKLVQGSRFDLLSLVMKKAVSLLDGSDAHCANIDAMLESLPEEFQLLFFKTLATDRPELFLDVAQHTAAFPALSDQILDLLA